MNRISIEVRTPRLTLRMPREDDAVIIATLINDRDIARMMSSVPWPYSLSDAVGFVQHTRELPPEKDCVLVADHADFGPIGVFGLTRKEDLHAELGFWLGRTFWNRGFATEATGALLGWAAESWGKRAIVAGHFADNAASGGVLCKAGFLYTGEVRPRFSLARGEAAPTRMMVWLA